MIDVLEALQEIFIPTLVQHHLLTKLKQSSHREKLPQICLHSKYPVRFCNDRSNGYNLLEIFLQVALPFTFATASFRETGMQYSEIAHLVCQTSDCTEDNSCSSSEDLIGLHGFMHTDGLFLYRIASQLGQLYHTLPCHSRQDSPLNMNKNLRGKMVGALIRGVSNCHYIRYSFAGRPSNVKLWNEGKIVC